ncbi:MAG: DUF418 domain-containing protein [Pseudonocardiaceae bacterium]
MRENAAGRIASLDVLRGVAILGTFGTNAWIFAHPGGPASFLSGGFAEGGVIETALRAVSNGKFLALLTLLFGVGLELQYRSAVRRGMLWPGRYLVRAAILFVEGLLHYVLIFEFDVLMAYAITSVLVAYLVGRSDRVVRAWMVGIGGGYIAVLGAGTALLLALPDDTATAAAGPGATASWFAQVQERLDAFLLYRSETVLIVPSAIVLFLLGSRLLRAGAFDETGAGARIRTRLMVFGLGVGAPLNALTAFGGPDWFLVDRYLLPPLVALGLLTLVTEVVLRTRREPGRLRRGFTAVGRTALSCYVLQNVVASVLCYGWGFGLAARFAGGGPWWVIGLWLGVCALFTVLADQWLRYFDRGPLEIVMHRIQATRRRPAATSARS